MFLSLVLKIANTPRQGCLSFLSPGMVCLTTLFSFLLVIPYLSCIKIYLCSHTSKTGTHGWVKERGRLQCNGTFKQLGQFRNRTGCHVIPSIPETLRQGRCSVPGCRAGCGTGLLHGERGLGRWLRGLSCSQILWFPLCSQRLRVMLHFSRGSLGPQSQACPSPLLRGTRCPPHQRSQLIHCHFILHSGPWHRNFLFILTILSPLLYIWC